MCIRDSIRTSCRYIISVPPGPQKGADHRQSVAAGANDAEDNDCSPPSIVLALPCKLKFSSRSRPCRVQTRCSRKPQKNREWEAQYPAGVESTTHTSSVAMLVSAPSMPINHDIVPASLRSLLL